MIDPLSAVQALISVAKYVQDTIEKYKDIGVKLVDIATDLSLLKEIVDKRDKRHESSIHQHILEFCSATEKVCQAITRQRAGNFAQKAAQVMFSKSVNERIEKLHARMKEFISLYNTDQFGKIEQGTWQIHDDFDALTLKLEEIMKDKYLDKISNEKAREFWAAHCTVCNPTVLAITDLLHRRQHCIFSKL